MPPKAKAKTAGAAAPPTSSSSSATAAAPPPKAVDSTQVLPSKEQTLFKAILRFYETKAYKKALKACELILKRFPQHGETLAMKGLIYSQLKRVDEAHALVKRGLAANLNSHVCWHVSGLLYRAEQNYDQAIKCFDERTQLLTFDGSQHRWQHIAELHTREEEGRGSSAGLLIASYDDASGALEYRPMSAPVVVRDGLHRMVDFRMDEEAVQLSVTGDHSMFAQRGREGEPSSLRPFERVAAERLLSRDPRRVVRMRPSADGGVAGGDKAACLPSALGLTTEDQRAAFYALCGAWVAGGCIVGCEAELVVPARRIADRAFLGSLLSRLAPALSEGGTEWRTGKAEREGDDGEGPSLAVTEQRWCRFVAQQRLSEEPHSLDCSRASTPSPSSVVSTDADAEGSPLDDGQSDVEAAVAGLLSSSPVSLASSGLLLSCGRELLRAFLAGYRQLAGEEEGRKGPARRRVRALGAVGRLRQPTRRPPRPLPPRRLQRSLSSQAGGRGGGGGVGCLLRGQSGPPCDAARPRATSAVD